MSQKTYILFSGGKDSMATCILAKEMGYKIDGIIMAQMMFSHKLGISAEHPVHQKWLDEVALPAVQEMLGVPVTVVRSSKDFFDVFYHTVKRSKYPERIGRYSGFPIASTCAIRRDLKIAPMNEWLKKNKDSLKILGLASDEVVRLNRMHKRDNEVSILEHLGITERNAFEICRNKGLLSPYYDLGFKRQGCWFRPNSTLKQFKFIKDFYPECWENLRRLSKESNLVSNNFRYGKTFDQIDALLKGANDEQR